MLTQVVQRGEGKTVPFLLGDGRETKRTQENGAGMRGEERRGEERRGRVYVFGRELREVSYMIKPNPL